MRSFRWLSLAAACAAAATTLTPFDALAQAPSASTTTINADGTASVTVVGPRDAAFARDRVIVRFRAGTAFLPGSGASRVLSAASNVHLVGNPPGLSVENVIARYRGNPNVVYAEPDFVVSAITTPPPNDPEYLADKQWDLAKISAQAAWGIHKYSANVVVAIVDTGIDFDHPDLVPNLYSDGGNPPIHGYTCMNGSCVPGGMDDHGHGTHVAGTIGAATDNGIGIAGINWTIKLLAIKFLGSGGSGSISDAVLGFDKLLQLKQANVNIRVTNNSWGGGGFSQALKDAMAALENTPNLPSTLNVCAAGNSGVNADFSPMYPAAYDNRGIVSVLASDINDVGAGFSNFGLASVDIAAPGVNTYSTESMKTCSLCDPSGYRYLSGTSMASPHVAGVAAAMLDLKPTLSAAQARDALLDPLSYVPMSDPKAQSTSSGGRLDYNKALTHASTLVNPPLNGFPTVSVGPDVFTTGGGWVNFSATVTDPDDSNLRQLTGRGPIGAGSAWLFGWEVGQLFPNNAGFNAPSLARTAAVPYDTSAADNRGGGASGRNWAVVSPVGPGSQPTGTLSVPATGTVGVAVPITFTANSDPQGPVAWDLWASGKSSSSGVCCYTGSSASIIFNAAGVYRVAVQAMDRELSGSDNYTAVISIDGATGEPPTAAATLDKESGPVPLTVNIDMGGSHAGAGRSISSYFIGCGGGFTAGSSGATGSCNFTDPGTYWLLLQVQDNLGNMALLSKYVVATPPSAPPPSDTIPPTVTITNPANGSNVSGVQTLQATATDNAGGSGVSEVAYYLDSTDTLPLGKASAAPYQVSWDAGSTTKGPHTILAVAKDKAGNTSNAASSITVVSAVPAVTLTAPPSIAKKATLAMTATIDNAPTYPITKVDFLIGTGVVCTDTTFDSINSKPTYSCTWKAPAASKTYQGLAKAYDDQGHVGTSLPITIKVN